MTRSLAPLRRRSFRFLLGQFAFNLAAAAVAAAILPGPSQRSWRQLGTTGASGRTPVTQPCPAPAVADGVSH